MHDPTATFGNQTAKRDGACDELNRREKSRDLGRPNGFPNYFLAGI